MGHSTSRKNKNDHKCRHVVTILVGRAYRYWYFHLCIHKLYFISPTDLGDIDGCIARVPARYTIISTAGPCTDAYHMDRPT